MKNLKAHPGLISELLFIRRQHCIKDCANCDNPALVSDSFGGDRVIFPRKPEVLLTVAKTMYCICIA